MKFHSASSFAQKFFRYLQKNLLIYISRLTREFRLVLPTAMLIFLLLNIVNPKSQFELSKETIQKNPTASHPHLYLAQQLFTTNQFEEAERELHLAAKNKTLEASEETQLLNDLTKITVTKNQPELVKTQIVFWQKIIAQFPNYRDAYIKLAILNWKIYRPFEAKRNLDIAFQIDPNNETVKNLNLRLLSPSE